MPQLFQFLPSIEVLHWSDILFLSFLGLFSALVLIWIGCIVISSLNSLFGNRMMPESETKDEGPQLNEALEKLEQSLAQATSNCLTNLKNELTVLLDKEVDKVASSLNAIKVELEESFSEESSKNPTIVALSLQEQKLGRLFSQASRRVAINVEKFNSENRCTSDLLKQIENISDSVDPEYILLIKEENLRFEGEDSLSVRVAKTVRRVIRWAEKKSRWFLQPIQLEKKIKKVKVRSVAYQRILENRLDQEFQNRSMVELKAVVQVIYKLKTLMSEASRVARFNLEAATADLEEKGTVRAVRETALGGMDRALKRIESILPEKEESLKKFFDSLQQSSKTALAQIRRDCDFADTVGEMSTRFIDQIKKRFKSQIDPTQKNLKKANRYLQRIWTVGRQRLTRARTQLGLEARSSNELIGLLDHATIKYAQNKVPTLYRRVFRFDPLSDEEFFVGRNFELEKIETGFKRWSGGRSSSIVIHGPSGSGKTSLVQCVAHRIFSNHKIFSKPIQHNVLTSTDLVIFLKELLELKNLNGASRNIVDLATTAKKQVGKSIVIVEGLQHLFQRRIGGFQVLQEFLRFITLTQPQFLWVVSASELGWAYLNSTKKVSQNFTFEIQAQNIDRKLLERVILVRHEITGYSLEFDSKEGLPRDLSWKIGRLKNPQEVQQVLKEAYFDELADLTNGNIFTAIYYWLCSLTATNDEKILVRFPRPIRQDSIRSLSSSQMSTLHAVLQHGSFDSDLHSHVFRSKSFVGEGILKELEQKNILYRKNNSGFFPNPIVVPTVLKVLKERNLV